MSLADKVMQIAQNEPKVYEAGKLALLGASRHMQGTASGEVVRLDDVSPMAHDMAVTLSSNTIADFSAVKIIGCGNNLLDIATAEVIKTKFSAQFTTEVTETGIKMVTNRDCGTPNGAGFCLGATANFLGKTLTVSFGAHSSTQADTTPRIRVIKYKELPAYVGQGYVGNTNYVYPIKVNNGENTLTFTVAQDTDTEAYPYIGVMFLLSGTNTALAGNTVEYSDIMIEVGNTATAYEPFTGATHTPNADGTLTVPSLYPTTTLFCDTAGVLLACSYLRDIDTYIDNVITQVALTGGE